MDNQIVQKGGLGKQEKAAVQLLMGGADPELVQELLGHDVDLLPIQIQYLKEVDPDQCEDKADLLQVCLDVLKKSEDIKKDQDFFELILELAVAHPNDHHVDPILFNVMVDPVVISSGHVFDRQSIVDDKGKVKYKQCPMTRQNIEQKVYPLSFLKGQLRNWLLGRFNKIVQIAREYKDDKDKFEKVCDLAEQSLNNLGEDVYKNEAKTFADLILSSPHLDNPDKFAKAYVRVLRNSQKEERNKFFVNEVS